MWALTAFGLLWEPLRCLPPPQGHKLFEGGDQVFHICCHWGSPTQCLAHGVYSVNIGERKERRKCVLWGDTIERRNEWVTYQALLHRAQTPSCGHVLTKQSYCFFPTLLQEDTFPGGQGVGEQGHSARAWWGWGMRMQGRFLFHIWHSKILLGVRYGMLCTHCEVVGGGPGTRQRQSRDSKQLSAASLKQKLLELLLELLTLASGSLCMEKGGLLH